MKKPRLRHIIIKLHKTSHRKIAHYVHDRFLVGKNASERTVEPHFYSTERKKPVNLEFYTQQKLHFKNEGEKLFQTYKS